MLLVLPFIVLAAYYVDKYLPRPLVVSQVHGVIDLAFIDGMDKEWLKIISLVAVLLLSYLLFFINERYKFLPQTTTLPSLFYVLLTSGIAVKTGFGYILIAIFIMAVAVGRLQSAINNSQANSPIFDLGCCAILVVAVYPKLILFVLWTICVLFFSGRSTLKDVAALFLGFITSALFIAFYFFWVGQLALLPGMFLDNLFSGEFVHTLPIPELIRLGLLLFLLLLSLYSIMTYSSVSIVNQRRGILSVVSMLLFLSLTLFIVPGDYYDFMYVLSLPLAFIYTQYFVTGRIRLFGNLMFVLFLTACFLTYLL